LGEAATGWVYTFCEDYGGDPSVPKEVPEPSAVDLPLPK
jgi:hypothetical protein